MDERTLNPSDYTVKPVNDIADKLPKYFTLSVASKRNSGKSYIVRELIQLLMREKKVQMVVVMSGTAHLNDDYDFLPPKLVMPFSESILKNLWAFQMKKKASERPHILVVLDDTLGDQKSIRNPTLQRYFCASRHVAISVIVISQHSAVLLSPIIKGNSDQIWWSKLNRAQLEDLWLSTVNVSKKDFVRLSEALGGTHYNFMVLDNYTSSTDPLEFIDVIRAKPP